MGTVYLPTGLFCNGFSCGSEHREEQRTTGYAGEFKKALALRKKPPMLRLKRFPNRTIKDRRMSR